jgi:hypothetical protein
MGGFYRLMRDWHGYLSAFAFLALLFFSATGILLNHPGLLAGEGRPLEEGGVTLSAQEIARVRTAPEPGRVLAEIVGGRESLVGEFQNGDVSGADVFVRMQSVRGSSDLRGNLETGRVEVTVERQPAVEVLNGLHRGELAGKAWRFWIDVIGGVLIVLSILGYILFFSLRFRLRTALVLTGLSLLAMVGLFVALVP